MTSAHRFTACLFALVIWCQSAWADNDGLDILTGNILSASSGMGEHQEFIDGNFDPAIVKRLKELDEKPDLDVLDFDFVTNSQDPDFAGIKDTIKSSTSAASTKSAVITVSFSQGNNQSVINYVVRRMNGAWKIYDVVYPTGDFALRNTLGLK